MVVARGRQAGASTWQLGGGGSDDSGPMVVVVVVSIVYGENGGGGCSRFARALSGPFVPSLLARVIVCIVWFGRVQLVDWQCTREWKVGGGSGVSMRAGVAELPKASVDALILVTTTT